MLAVWRKTRWLKRGVGLSAAYLLAVQLLLAAAISTQMTLAHAGHSDAIILCYGDHTAEDPAGSTDKPIRIAGKPVTADCAICAFASLAPPLPQTVQFSPTPLVALALQSMVSPEKFATIRRHDPRTSQGPPRLS